jgi:hypothetical protein
MGNMKEQSYDDLDDLLAKIRWRVLRLRQTDPETGEELRDLFRQLELWVDSLVVNSIKLRSLTEKAKEKSKKPGTKRRPAG